MRTLLCALGVLLSSFAFSQDVIGIQEIGRPSSQVSFELVPYYNQWGRQAPQVYENPLLIMEVARILNEELGVSFAASPQEILEESDLRDRLSQSPWIGPSERLRPGSIVLGTRQVGITTGGSDGNQRREYEVNRNRLATEGGYSEAFIQLFFRDTSSMTGYLVIQGRARYTSTNIEVVEIQRSIRRQIPQIRYEQIDWNNPAFTRGLISTRRALEDLRREIRRNRDKILACS